jgi:hypothetical protein
MLQNLLLTLRLLVTYPVAILVILAEGFVRAGGTYISFTWSEFKRLHRLYYRFLRRKANAKDDTQWEQA